MANNLYNSTPALTFTLDQFVAMQFTDDITFRNFSIIEMSNNTELLDHNILDDYLSELERICVDCKLDDDQIKKYKYAPDLLAYDVYGSVQLDFIIMAANGIIDPKEFNFKSIRLPYASKLKAFVNAVYNAERIYISQNRADNGLKNYL